jgi:hypothetical protein
MSFSGLQILPMIIMRHKIKGDYLSTSCDAEQGGLEALNRLIQHGQAAVCPPTDYVIKTCSRSATAAQSKPNPGG